MKWIGQHIYDYISRFRNDVYLESVSSGTIASGGNLGLDSNNKIVKQSDTGITDLHGAGVDGAANQLLTDDGDGTITSEANLTFDGSILNLTSIMDISPANDAGAAALTIDNDDTDQIALDIIASNIDADVINIAADSVTTANVIDISCDALTTGSGLFIDDNSAAAGLTGARSIAKFRQNNIAATAATALEVISNGATTGVLIDKNASGTAAQNCQALYVDFDRTVAGSGTSAHNDIGINLDVNSASLGTSSLKGMDIDVVGATSGTSTAFGMDLSVSGADTNTGVSCSYEGTSSGAGLILRNTATSSATEGGKLRLISSDGAAMGDDHRFGVIEFRASDGDDSITGASIEAFADAAWSTSENGGRLVFNTTDGDDTQSVVLTLDSDKLATFTGAVTVTGALTGTLATASQTNITGVGTISTGVWGGTKIGDLYSNTGGRRYGNILKILPQDFMKNDDSSGNALNYKDGANAGVQVDNASLEAMAFVTIPEGMKATHVDMYGSAAADVAVIASSITESIAWSGASAATDLAGGSGAMNSQITLSSAVDATADNMLGIKVTLTATNQRIYGGKVTIAAQ